VKKEFHATAMRIGKPVFKAIAEPSPAYIASDCQLAGHLSLRASRRRGRGGTARSSVDAFAQSLRDLAAGEFMFARKCK
jgi:hypothetical protein